MSKTVLDYILEGGIKEDTLWEILSSNRMENE